MVLFEKPKRVFISSSIMENIFVLPLDFHQNQFVLLLLYQNLALVVCLNLLQLANNIFQNRANLVNT